MVSVLRSLLLGRAALREIATIAAPDTLLRWHRQLIARKRTYAKSSERRGVRPGLGGLLNFYHRAA
jgi:hypothetical protein